MEKRDLERDISRVAAGGRVFPSPGDVNIQELLRRDEPGVMRAAEDLLRQRGWKLREITGGLHVRNFTIELLPMWGPREQWKMVQTNVDVATHRKTRAGYHHPREPGHGRVWVKMSVANGRVRLEREREFQSGLDDARKVAVANAWAVAKAIKGLPLDTDPAVLERIVDKHFGRRSVDPKLRDIV